VLVTIPDLLDFHSDAVHLPLLAPADEVLPQPRGTLWPQRDRFKIVHVTTHPGLEGTTHIRRAVDRLRDRGYPLEFVFLHLVPPGRVLREYADADLAIGKMKMGYYANAQIESMALGVPTVTYVRDEFMTDELRDSGFIFATLDTLEGVLEHYLLHPEQLAEKRAKARRSILALHDNDELARRLLKLYAEVRQSSIRAHR
jgi:Glycosyl transferases group 1